MFLSSGFMSRFSDRKAQFRSDSSLDLNSEVPDLSLQVLDSGPNLAVSFSLGSV